MLVVEVEEYIAGAARDGGSKVRCGVPWLIRDNRVFGPNLKSYGPRNLKPITRIESRRRRASSKIEERLCRS